MIPIRDVLTHGLQVEQMKKQKAKKAGGKKEEKAESVAETPKAEEEKPEAEPELEPTPEYTNEDTNEDEKMALLASESKDTEETVPELNKAQGHGRQPSISVQSKLRSSSFRASSGGPLSPGYGFSPDGDTAPDIYRKQAIRIEELENQNKRLSKEASDGEKRWKKAEEELEDLREADGDSAKGKDTSSGTSPQELEKLVSPRSEALVFVAYVVHRERKSQPYNDKMPNSSHELQDTAPRHPYLRLHRQISKLLFSLRTPRSSQWRS